MKEDGREALQELADKCRRLARSASSAEVAATLNAMAEDYARKAQAESEDAPAPIPPNPTG